MDEVKNQKKTEKIIFFVTEKKHPFFSFCDAYSLKTQKTPRFYFFFKILSALYKNGQK